MKGNVRTEIYFLLSKGLKPKEIMKILPEAKSWTVYTYSSRMNRMKENLISRGIIDIDGKIKVKVD